MFYYIFEVIILRSTWLPEESFFCLREVHVFGLLNALLCNPVILGVTVR